MADRPKSTKRRRLSVEDSQDRKKMARTVELKPIERTLQLLLLDVVDFIRQGASGSRPKDPNSALILRFTGGWVRDKLLGVDSHDIDVGISTMTGYQFGLAMKEYLDIPTNVRKYTQRHTNDDFQSKIGGLHKIDANPEKSKHLETVTTKIFGLDLDFVNLRKEVYLPDSRNPQMEFGTPEEDALRRDATVNALFYNIHTNEVEDFTGQGLDDMAAKIIRTPLAPYETFRDDPLRVLRLIRFASRLGYRIDSEAEKAMDNAEIKAALKMKISRERVGKEIEKMLKGPGPHMALSTIDRLNLYKTVFCSPDSVEEPNPQLHFTAAYDGLQEILNGVHDIEGDPRGELKDTLIRGGDDFYHSWLLASFVPWAYPLGGERQIAPERGLTTAAKVARDSIKADNKFSKVLEESVRNWQHITNEKAHLVETPPEDFTGPDVDNVIRGRLGMAIRRWGPNWRLQTLYAILIEITRFNADSAGLIRVLKDWATFTNQIKKFGLLDAQTQVPIMNANKIREALGVNNTGPWMKNAVEMVSEWQFRNPNGEKEGACEEVRKRRSELGV